jgi:hypothetical protein
MAAKGGAITFGGNSYCVEITLVMKVMTVRPWFAVKQNRRMWCSVMTSISSKVGRICF